MAVEPQSPSSYLPMEVWSNTFQQGSVTDAIACTRACREFRLLAGDSLFQKWVFINLFKDAHPVVKSYASSILNRTDTSPLMSKVKRVFDYQVHIITTFSSAGKNFLATFSLIDRITPKFYAQCNEWFHHQHLVFFGLLPHVPSTSTGSPVATFLQDNLNGVTLRAKDSFLYEVPTEFLLLHPEVQVLDVEHNNISFVPFDALAETTLRTANFSRNDIRSIEISEGIFEEVLLEELDLTINQISSFPKSLKKLSRLQTLLIGHNRITTLPDEIALVRSLRRLDINSNRLVSISPQISSLANLQSLNLAHNPNLRSLPDLSGLRALVHLDISDTGMTLLPKELETLPRLETVDASENFIRCLPSSIGSAKRITTLKLTKNQIKEIPEDIQKMSSLRELHLSGNLIRTIPKNLDQMTSLTKLYVYNNPLTLTRNESEAFPFTIYYKFPETETQDHPNKIDEQEVIQIDQTATNSFLQGLKESFLKLIQENFVIRFED